MNKSSKKILVTGVAGFLGSHLAEKLSDLNFEVIGIDNMSGGYKDNIPKKYLNTSAKKIKNKKKVKYFKKYIVNYENLNINENLSAGIITPDREIVENSDLLHPAYLTFDNYELILKWNRSLRFALAVCTLKEKFENEL